MLLLLSAARVSYKGVETRQGTGLALGHDRPLLFVKALKIPLFSFASPIGFQECGGSLSSGARDMVCGSGR